LVRGEVSPTGGSVCLPEKKVCLEVPSGALEKVVEIWIGESQAEAPAPLGGVYEIGPSGTIFVAPAQVTFSYDFVPGIDDGTLNTDVLRVWTTGDDGGWQPLATPTFDRRVHSLGGSVSHLSPFTVMRTDRDAGTVDAGTPDAGRVDAGPNPKPDAGYDAGVKDAGTDAGYDAGPADAGRDAGYDAGVDAGFDAGVDAGNDAGVDAGNDAGVDAGFDAGSDAGVDAGDDAGFDAGTDAGDGG
jgi:hypothetical protein